MEGLLTNSNSYFTSEDSFSQIILDVSCIESNINSSKKTIDISKASIEELSSLIVSDMISSVKKDLAKIVSK
ncbi:MAG: hypothetical protein H6589_12670 [Flavobacteriales bacterium]|nr:hypothetical protein [Flavobacteriales bacterium]